MTGCTILGKCEFMNPGQSVKDRAALYIIRDAIAKGQLKPGGTIVEGTAGNTGIGLALVGASMGFRTVIVIPRRRARRRRTCCALRGPSWCRCRRALPQPQQLCPLFRPSGRGSGADRAQRGDLGQPVRQCGEPAGACGDDGPRDLGADGGRVDGFICAVGSGGTLAGVAEALQPKGVKIGLADPEGAALHAFYTEGKLEAPGSSITEGIGQGRITANLEGLKPDFSYRIPDAEALPLIFDLLEDEGLCMGGSSGINIAGAIRMARDMGPGKTIVTILCDYGSRYQSKVWNPVFLREKGLPVPNGWRAGRGRCRRSMKTSDRGAGRAGRAAGRGWRRLSCC